MKDKVAFILYGTDEWILEENLEYIRCLSVPDDVEIEIYKQDSRQGVPECLENGRVQSDAGYKVYLDQNAYIIDKDFIQKFLDVFRQNPQIGMLGTRGYLWNQEKNEAEFEGCNLSHVYADMSFVRELREGTSTGIRPVLALDRHLMITHVDTPWTGEENNFHITKSVELLHAGIETAVLVEDKPMVLFDNGILAEN